MALVQERVNLLLLGRTGSGKSSCGNTIMRKKVFLSKKSFKTVTHEVQMVSNEYYGVTVKIYDTPGLCNPERSNEDVIEQLRPLIQSTDKTVILIVMKADRVTTEDQQALQLIEGFIPEWLITNTWILFTRGDELQIEEQTIEQFIDETEELKKIVQRFQNRFHVFNNLSKSSDQVRKLLNKIIKVPLFPEMELLSQTPPPYAEEDALHRRIVLLGKTGSGKSATGNTILGDERFRSEFSQSSVTSECEMQQAVVSGRNVSVIDTPAVFDTNKKPELLAEEIGRGISLSGPGPHAFLLHLPVNARFTEQEENVIQELENIFGREMNKYTIIVFTYGDLLEESNIDRMLQENRSLSKLIDQCGGRYHIFNNSELRNREQVTELLEKIDRMVVENGGSCYSNKMLEEAEKARRKKESNHVQRFKRFFYTYKKVVGIVCLLVCPILTASLVHNSGGSLSRVGIYAGTVIAICVFAKKNQGRSCKDTGNAAQDAHNVCASDTASFKKNL